MSHDARLLPREVKPGRCRDCGDSMEDHEYDPETTAYVCQIRGCECNDGDVYTRDDWDADEGDRAWDEYKSGGY